MADLTNILLHDNNYFILSLTNSNSIDKGLYNRETQGVKTEKSLENIQQRYDIVAECFSRYTIDCHLSIS